MKANDNDKKINLAGVFPTTKKNGEAYFRASITYLKKHISLGSYDSAEAAHNAYLEADMIFKNNSVTINSYNDDNVLLFQKWVSLINFRDNGIYFATPIYMSKRFFYYYMSPQHILKFDMDDLFYFSSRKIMQRGNHYFVADYGMQVNIASRYGIKNYAVEGRDYRFINGDSLDFRRENLEILNKYNGVTLEKKNGQYIYTVRIHIKGNYIVGKYKTELEAAIAYNKAIDILAKKGINKNFSPNYIEGLSPRRYVDIYSELPISKKILNYFSE